MFIFAHAIHAIIEGEKNFNTKERIITSVHVERALWQNFCRIRAFIYGDDAIPWLQMV
jgi:hypothetical protein